MALAKFWAPVPWMLEAAILLQLLLHEYPEAAVVAGRSTLAGAVVFAFAADLLKGRSSSAC